MPIHSEPCNKVKSVRATSRLRPNKLIQLGSPLTLLQLRHQRVKPWSCTRACNLAQSRNGAKRASLKLSCALYVLFHRVLSDRWAFHAGLEEWSGLAQALRNGSRRQRCKTEKNHMAYNLDLVGNICEADKDVRKQLVQVKLRQRRV